MRLLCSRGDDTAPDVQDALDAIVTEFGLHATALPLKSVGVKADLRCYEHPVLVSGVAPFGTLLEATRRILGDVPDVNRVIWNLSATAPGRFRPLEATMVRERLDLLREADHLVMEGLQRHGLYDDIWQCPTAMVPLEIDGRGRELVVIRPVLSERAMTARPAELPAGLLNELRESILRLEGVSGVALDLTGKPPGTIEWE